MCPLAVQLHQQNLDRSHEVTDFLISAPSNDKSSKRCKKENRKKGVRKKSSKIGVFSAIDAFLFLKLV